MSTFPHQRRTAWHPMLAGALRRYLPQGYELKEEHTLGGHPQNIDILLLRQVEVLSGEPARLSSVLHQLAPHTLIEFKGPTDSLSGEDFATLLAYGFRYCQQNQIFVAQDILLIWLVDHLSAPFQRALTGYEVTLHQARPGVWNGFFGSIRLRLVETSVAGLDRLDERLLLTFSRDWRLRQDLLAQLVGVDVDVWETYNDLRVQVLSYRTFDGGVTLTAAEAFRDFDTFREQTMNILSAAEERLLADMPVERRLRGLSAEERLRGLAAEERLRGLAVQDVLRALGAEDLEQLRQALLLKSDKP